MTARPITTKFLGHGCNHISLISHHESSFDSQATWVIDVFGIFLDMLSMGICTTRHWETSGRLVQELNSVLYKHVCLHSRVKSQLKITQLLSLDDHLIQEYTKRFRHGGSFDP